MVAEGRRPIEEERGPSAAEGGRAIVGLLGTNGCVEAEPWVLTCDALPLALCTKDALIGPTAAE